MVSPKLVVSPLKCVLLTACIFVLMLLLTGFCANYLNTFLPANSKQNLLAASVVQNLVAFCGTALLTSFFITPRPFAFLGLQTSVRMRWLFTIVMVFILGMPFLNEMVYFNESVKLPGFLAGFERWARSAEESAQRATNILLQADSVPSLLAGVAVVGLLTGVSEELFFRGTLQRIFTSSGLNHHLAIWIAAAIFSLLHFQFFGFVPRLLLGAFFGYLFYWSGSIWVSAIAHAINNSLVVVTHWALASSAAKNSIETFGVQTTGFPWIAVVSLLLVLLFIYFQRNNKL